MIISEDLFYEDKSEKWWSGPLSGEHDTEARIIQPSAHQTVGYTVHHIQYAHIWTCYVYSAHPQDNLQ